MSVNVGMTVLNSGTSICFEEYVILVERIHIRNIFQNTDGENNLKNIFITSANWYTISRIVKEYMIL